MKSVAPHTLSAALASDPLSLHREQKWLLKRLRNPTQKARGVGSVDQPVIVREGKRENQARLEFTSIAHPLRLHARTRKAENRYFWMIHNRRETCAANSA